MFLRYGKDQMRALDTEECVLCNNASKYLPTHLIRAKKCKKSRLPREIPPRTVGEDGTIERRPQKITRWLIISGMLTVRTVYLITSRIFC